MFYYLLDKLNSARGCRYLFVTPLPYAIGTASEEILMAGLCAQEANRTLILLCPMTFTEVLGFRRCNRVLFDLTIGQDNRWDAAVKLVIEFAVSLEFFLRRSLALSLKNLIDFSERWRFPTVGIRNAFFAGIPSQDAERRDAIDLPPFPPRSFSIRIPRAAEDACLQVLRTHGLAAGTYVCLHVRESGYRRDSGRREYRNASIRNYVESVQRLTRAGFQVVRMGDASMTPFPGRIDGLIDYPFAAWKTEAMDLCLLQNCSFFVGMASGVLDTAWLFQKPVLVTNLFSAYSEFPRNRMDRGICQHVRPKGSDHPLSLREWLAEPWSAHTPLRDITDYEFTENSASEIYDAVDEFVSLQESGESRTALQVEFNRRLKESMIARQQTKADGGLEGFHTLSFVQKVRFARTTASVEGTLSSRFLESCF